MEVYPFLCYVAKIKSITFLYKMIDLLESVMVKSSIKYFL